MLKCFVTSLNFLIAFIVFGQDGFKENQLRYTNVREAYRDRGSDVEEKIAVNGMNSHAIEVYLRIFKKEQELELWAKNKKDSTFVCLETFKICFASGQVGPKRRRHDLQVHEGFYKINQLNPKSSYFLALGINYPNVSDRVLGEENNLGGNIAIHGGCISVGCIPITDELIKTLYIYCVEAKNGGQIEIPVTLFPCRFTKENKTFLEVLQNVGNNTRLLWRALEENYIHFNENKTLQRVPFQLDGTPVFNND